MGGRWALYWGSISMRTRGLPLSKAQITPSGLKVSTILMNMLKKPNSALVERPSGAFMGWRMAWKARCIKEFPSMTAMVLGMGLLGAGGFSPYCIRLLRALCRAAGGLYVVCAFGCRGVLRVQYPDTFNCTHAL